MIARASIRLVSWVVLAYLVLPLVVILGSSVTASQFLTFPPRGITLHWYQVMLSDPSYVAAFSTSTLTP